MAEGVGLEPTVPFGIGGFQDRCITNSANPPYMVAQGGIEPLRHPPRYFIASGFTVRCGEPSPYLPINFAL